MCETYFFVFYSIFPKFCWVINGFNVFEMFYFLVKHLVVAFFSSFVMKWVFERVLYGICEGELVINHTKDTCVMSHGPDLGSNVTSCLSFTYFWLFVSKTVAEWTWECMWNQRRCSRDQRRSEITQNAFQESSHPRLTSPNSWQLILIAFA